MKVALGGGGVLRGSRPGTAEAERWEMFRVFAFASMRIQAEERSDAPFSVVQTGPALLSRCRAFRPPRRQRGRERRYEA